MSALVWFLAGCFGIAGMVLASDRFPLRFIDRLFRGTSLTLGGDR